MAEVPHDALAAIESGEFKPVEIDLDAGKAAEGKDAKDNKGQGTERKPPVEDENVAALRRQLADQTRAREAAERQAREIEARRQQAEAQSSEGQLRHITSAMETATNDRARAKADLAQYAAAGDWSKHADAQEALNDAQIRMDRLGAGKADLERRVDMERRASEQRRTVPDDPVEAMIAAGSITGQSAAWLRRNRECVTDPRKNRQMVRAHEDAIEDGIAPDSADYFAFVESRLGIGSRDDGENRQEQHQERRQHRRDPASQTAAPPSRNGSGDGRGSRPNTVTLSPVERQFCKEAGIDEVAYARNKHAAKAEGLLN